MRMRLMFLAAGILGISGPQAMLSGQTAAVERPVSPFAAEQQLHARFHELWLRAAVAHSGWERGLWLRAPTLAADRANRAALVRFLRVELVPYFTTERAVFYAVADSILDRERYTTTAAFSESRRIAGLVDTVDATADSPDPRGFRTASHALSAVVNRSFASDRLLIEEVLTLAPRRGAQRVAIETVR